MNDKLLSLPPIAQMMRDAGLEPKKALGQNFLFDLNLTGKIARSVPDIENSTVVEVGPGPGGLTRALLGAGARRVIAIEKDKSTEPILSKISAAANGRLEVIFGDALRQPPLVVRHRRDDTPPARGGDIDRIAICSNLPYNIGTELLIQWLHCAADENSPLRISSMTLMFQREVAMRIVAGVGDEQYGRLGVLTSLVADSRILFNVPATAFHPAPKVQSAVVQIIPNADKIRTLKGLDKIEKLTAKLFGQRRKMIRGIMRDVDWARFGLTGTERAEELPPAKFEEIATNL
jgi:16S rRNA (adenine1518-N6/adenine1519-N6)-dimethyltransferase